MIRIVQSKYYGVKISELSLRKQELQNTLQHFSFHDKMKEYTEGSMQLFKNKLYQKYKGENVQNIPNGIFVLNQKNLLKIILSL
jgi:hypothetical protein